MLGASAACMLGTFNRSQQTKGGNLHMTKCFEAAFTNKKVYVTIHMCMGHLHPGCNAQYVTLNSSRHLNKHLKWGWVWHKAISYAADQVTALVPSPRLLKMSECFSHVVKLWPGLRHTDKLMYYDFSFSFQARRVVRWSSLEEKVPNQAPTHSIY